MKKNHCIEEPITPITYFNPENYLPKYDHSDMPDFNKKLVIAKKPLRAREKVIDSKLKLNEIH